MSKKSLSDLNACSDADFVAALANIFEYSPWIAEKAVSARPFAGVKQLFAAMKAVVNHASPDLRLALIKAHPDLANKTQRAAGLTAESSAEQNSAGLDRLSDAEYQAFERVNTAYGRKFGFPYIVCVRRHTKDSVLRDFERRLPNDAATEIQVSIGEIFRIAALRVDQLVMSDDRLQVHGHLSTHVLDTHGGTGRSHEIRIDRAGGARREPRHHARDYRCRRPQRSAPDPQPAGTDRQLRTELSHGGLFCRARGADIRSALSRPHHLAVFGERA
jgi:OHCU decarboxylase